MLLGAVAAVAATTIVLTVVVGLHWLLWWLLALNVVTYALYRWDKRAATRSLVRVPELTLHGLALVGGSPGALAGRHLGAESHKTSWENKKGFLVTSWLIMTLQVGAAALWLVRFR